MNLLETVRTLQKAGVVVFPTDTVWGVGCAVDKPAAIERLYAMKDRAATKPTAILVADVDMANIYGVVNKQMRMLAEKYWPGGLTMVMQAKGKVVPSVVRGGGTTVGIRVPDHDGLRKVLRQLGVGVVAASANRAGQPAPKQRQAIDTEFLKLVDGVMEGTAGGQEPSTVVRVDGEKVEVLRKGGGNNGIWYGGCGMNIKRVAVGSTNPVKVRAVVEAIGGRLKGVQVKGVEVASGVSEQPMTDVETKTGALNRARLALEAVGAEIGVGLEGGVFRLKGDVWNTVWCCAISSEGRVELVNGERFILPRVLAEPLLAGEEMGPVMDRLTARKNIRHQEGMLGVVTTGWVTRVSAYTHLTGLALGRLLTDEWR